MCAQGFCFYILSVLFPEVCGSGLDSHHGYVVEYGEYRETDHVGKYWEAPITGLFIA